MKLQSTVKVTFLVSYCDKIFQNTGDGKKIRSGNPECAIYMKSNI